MRDNYTLIRLKMKRKLTNIYNQPIAEHENSDDDRYDKIQMVMVDRKDQDKDKVWKSACETFSKDTFDPSSFIIVTFIGNDGKYEEALDGLGGGPTREFFRILMDAIRHNNYIFSGPEYERYIRMDMTDRYVYIYRKTVCF